MRIRLQQAQEETICHMFWDCPITQQFWMDVSSWMTEKCEHCVNLIFSKELIVFGSKEQFKSDKVFDLILLLAKFHVYKCKLQDTIPNKAAFVKMLKSRYEIERYNNAVTSNLHRFFVDWVLYMVLIE